MDTLPIAQLKCTTAEAPDVDRLADFTKFTALAGRETA